MSMEEELIGNIGWNTFWKAYNSFRYFVKEVLPLSIKNYIPAKHLEEWAEILEKNKKTALLAPRGHLKSTLMYAYLMWRVLRSFEQKEKWLYISFKQDMAQYHVRNFKRMVEENPIFTNLYDFTDAEYIAEYGWNPRKPSFELIPAGITSFKRGWHGTGVIADDILADPAQELNPTTIKKITRIFFEDVIYLPNPEGFLHLVGTPQHREDLFFLIRDKQELEFKWHRYPAILDDVSKKVLWPERWPYEELERQRTAHPKSFKKEMMVEPVWEVGSFLDRKKLYECINKEAKPWPFSFTSKAKIGQKVVIGGWDIGKKSHPSHIAIFLEENKKLKMIWEKWMDRWDYTKQLDLVRQAIDIFKVDRIYYDATRGELEAYAERSLLPSQLKPISFTAKRKHALATLLEETINTKQIELINNSRTISEMLKVNTELEAYESETGHGDSFWSIAMAVNAWKDLGKAPNIRFG